MSANCNRARELLSARLDHPLDERESAELRLHLTRCPACARFERRLVDGMAGIAALPPLAGSGAVRAAVLEHLGEYGKRSRLGQGAKLLVGTAAVIALALVLMTVLRGTGNDDEVEPGVAGGLSGTIDATGREATVTPSPVAPTPMGASVCPPTILSTKAEDGGVYIWAVIDLVEGCTLVETVELQLFDPEGDPIAVEGNRLDLPLISLSSRRLTYVGVRWENWCGDPAVAAAAIHSGGGYGRVLDATPECADPDAPSRITAHRDPPPAELLAEPTPSQLPKVDELGVRTADGQVIITNVESGEVIQIIDANLGGQDFFASFSGDGSRFAFIDSEPSDNGLRNVLEVYDTATWQLVTEVETPDVIRYLSPWDGLVLSKQGRYAFVYNYNDRTRNDGPVRYWLSAYEIDTGLWLSPEVELPGCGVATLARADAESAVAIACGGDEPQVIEFSVRE